MLSHLTVGLVRLFLMAQYERFENLGTDKITGRQRYRLLEPVTWKKGGINSPFGIGVEVPAGYITDLASVPRIFWRILPPFGEYSSASIVHDYLCEHGSWTGCPRWLADAIFYQIMVEHGVPYWKRLVMWAAVRLAANVGGKS